MPWYQKYYIHFCGVLLKTIRQQTYYMYCALTFTFECMLFTEEYMKKSITPVGIEYFCWYYFINNILQRLLSLILYSDGTQKAKYLYKVI